MEKNQKEPADDMKKKTTTTPAADGFLVVWVKWLLNLNYLKYGIIKKF
jgi:hypothetical protein